jgi:hypothetical protein
MDDDEIRSAIRVLTEPRTAPPGTRDQILRRVTARRRRSGALLATAAVAVVGVVAMAATVGLPGQRSLSPAGSGQDRTVPITSGGWPTGFSAEMTVEFPNNRNLLSGRFELNGKTYPVTFYPNDGTDNDVQPNPLPLEAGVTVTAQAQLAPDCDAKADPPDLHVRSRLDNGNVTTDRFTVSNPGKYAAAVAKWCTEGAQVTVEAFDSNPAGGVKITLRIVNPGPDSVTITSDAYDIGITHWNLASVAVPAAATRTMIVTATHSGCNRQHVPWTDGHLTSNGTPIEIPQGHGC